MGVQCDCIDYPVSWDYWRDHCRTVHNYDPGPNEVTPLRESTWQDDIEQLRDQVAELSQRLEERRPPKKRRDYLYD